MRVHRELFHCQFRPTKHRACCRGRRRARGGGRQRAVTGTESRKIPKPRRRQPSGVSFYRPSQLPHRP